MLFEDDESSQFKLIYSTFYYIIMYVNYKINLRRLKNGKGKF